MSQGLCPHCGAENDAFTCISDEGALPDAGDVSICFTCGEVSIFIGQGVEVRPASDAELAELRLDARITKAQTYIRANQ